MTAMLQIAPSVMCADLLNVGRELALMEAGGADWVHVDVMDGHFVPGFTFGADAVRQMRRATALPIEAHLMSDEPLAHVDAFVDAGCDLVYVHAEIAQDLYRVLATLRRAGCRAGVALNPGTPETDLSEVLELVDAVLVMTVSPGFVGQPLLRGALEKARRLVEWRRDHGREDLTITVDGGVKLAHVAELAALGVDRAVSGTGVFASGVPTDVALRRMKELCGAAIAGVPERERAGAGRRRAGC